jgi:hypothetical protein
MVSESRIVREGDDTMADQPIRVLFRWLAGLPKRQASEEELRQVGESWVRLAEKWKSEGVRHIGYWMSDGWVDGFAHYHILEIDDVSQVRKMAGEFSQAVGKYVEKFSFHIGTTFPDVEDFWRSP